MNTASEVCERQHLAGDGFHGLATATGSSPGGRRGTDPEAAALATQFQLEYTEELLDTLIANYSLAPEHHAQETIEAGKMVHVRMGNKHM